MLNWVGFQPMKMRETSRGRDKKLVVNNNLSRRVQARKEKYCRYRTYKVFNIIKRSWLS